MATKQQEEGKISNAIEQLLSVYEKRGMLLGVRSGSGNIAVPNAKGGGYRRFVTGRPGWPDRTVLMPGGRYIMIEVKTSTGVQSDRQKEIQARIEALGGTYLLARSVKEVQEFLDAYEWPEGFKDAFPVPKKASRQITFMNL